MLLRKGHSIVGVGIVGCPRRTVLVLQLETVPRVVFPRHLLLLLRVALSLKRVAVLTLRVIRNRVEHVASQLLLSEFGPVTLEWSPAGNVRSRLIFHTEMAFVRLLDSYNTLSHNVWEYPVERLTSSSHHVGPGTLSANCLSLFYQLAATVIVSTSLA